MTDETKSESKPEAKFKAGSVHATIWKQQGEHGEYFTVNLVRNYKDKKDEWQKTSNFRVNDLPKAIMVLQEAYEELLLKEEREGSE